MLVGVSWCDTIMNIGTGRRGGKVEAGAASGKNTVSEAVALYRDTVVFVAVAWWWLVAIGAGPAAHKQAMVLERHTSKQWCLRLRGRAVMLTISGGNLLT